MEDQNKTTELKNDPVIRKCKKCEAPFQSSGKVGRPPTHCEAHRKAKKKPAPSETIDG